MNCELCNMNCPPPQNAATGRSSGFSRQHWTQAALGAYRARKELNGKAGFSDPKVTIWDHKTKTWVQIQPLR